MAAFSVCEQDCKLLKAAVRKAGALSLEYYGRALNTKKKHDGSPVSEADLAIDELLKNELLSPRPDYGWLSEETEDSPERLEKKRLWIIDPIDGTRAFLNGRAEWVISAALVEEGVPLAAAVYNPVKEEFFDAAYGQGANLNGKTIKVSSSLQDEDIRAIVPLKILEWFEDSIAFSSRVWANSIAYRMCLVSAGRADVALIKMGASDWDLAAAHLILTEAGGQMTSFTAEDVVFNRNSVQHKNLLATNGILHNKLLKVCENLEF